MIFHPLRSTPTKGLEVVLGLPPLDLFVKREAAMARLRTRALLKEEWDGLGNCGETLTSKGHRRHWDDFLRRVYPAGTVVDEIPAVLRLGGDEEEVSDSPAFIIYTDGSKMGEAEESGYGWVATLGDTVLDEGCGKLSRATVYQAELVAICSALEWLQTQTKERGDCLIRADSQSALLAIKSHLVSSRLVLMIHDRLEMARRDRKVSFSWVRGHDDNTGNEVADMLAKAGCTSPMVRDIPMSKAILKAGVRKIFREEWQKRWSIETTCRNTRSFLPSVGEKRQNLIKFRRPELTLLSQVFTGHGLWDYHLAHWKEISSICSLCRGGEGTSWHLWAECDALARERIKVPEEEGENALSLAYGILSFFSSTPIRVLMRRNGDL